MTTIPTCSRRHSRKRSIDWIHWGGQLIISGPRNLERLKGTFLADYLPARAGKAVTISRQILKQLDNALVHRRRGIGRFASGFAAIRQPAAERGPEIVDAAARDVGRLMYLGPAGFWSSVESVVVASWHPRFRLPTGNSSTGSDSTNCLTPAFFGGAREFFASTAAPSP